MSEKKSFNFSLVNTILLVTASIIGGLVKHDVGLVEQRMVRIETKIDAGDMREIEIIRNQSSMDTELKYHSKRIFVLEHPNRRPFDE